MQGRGVSRLEKLVTAIVIAPLAVRRARAGWRRVIRTTWIVWLVVISVSDAIFVFLSLLVVMFMLVVFMFVMLVIVRLRRRSDQ